MRNFATSPVSLVSSAAVGCLALAFFVSGCASSSMESARTSFYNGNLIKAAADLNNADDVKEKDHVLFLMERGLIRQSLGQYKDSTRDFNQASDKLDLMITKSVSEGASSMVINDMVLSFMGNPYERTLMHAFCAKSYLAMLDWDDAAVEGRRIIKTLSDEERRGFPEVAYARYVAGLTLELVDEGSNARLQYRKASTAAPGVSVHDRSGCVIPNYATNRYFSASAPTLPLRANPAWDHDLVCFVLIGGIAPSGDQLSPASYADIFIDGIKAGRSYTLSDTAELLTKSEEKKALKKTAKAITRIVAKDAIADVIERENEALGVLTRVVLIGLLEQPDLRRWETLPRYLQVARVACPANLRQFEVVYRTPTNFEIQRVKVTTPLVKRGRVFVSFCRDLKSPANMPWPPPEVGKPIVPELKP